MSTASRSLRRMRRVLSDYGERDTFRRMLALESMLKDALDYIDNPAEAERNMMSPTLIVQAGRRLLGTK